MRKGGGVCGAKREDDLREGKTGAEEAKLQMGLAKVGESSGDILHFLDFSFQSFLDEGLVTNGSTEDDDARVFISRDTPLEGVSFSRTHGMEEGGTVEAVDRIKPRFGPSLTRMSTMERSSSSSPTALPSSWNQTWRGRVGTAARMASMIGWRVIANRCPAKGSPCCTPVVLERE